MMDSVTENIREEPPWQIMFAVSMGEIYVLELELEQRRQALEKIGMEVSRTKAECMCLNGTPFAHLPQVTEFKYLRSTTKTYGDMDAEVSNGTQCG